MGFGSCTQQSYVKEPPLISLLKCKRTVDIEEMMVGVLDVQISLVFFYHFITSTVWQNGGDRQHAEPRLCSKVHLGLLF